jgi:hypothetical protein
VKRIDEKINDLSGKVFTPAPIRCAPCRLALTLMENRKSADFSSSLSQHTLGEG